VIQRKWIVINFDFADAVEAEEQGPQCHQEEGGQEGSQGRGGQIHWHQDAQASVFWKERSWKDRQEIILLYVLAHVFTYVRCELFLGFIIKICNGNFVFSLHAVAIPKI
jgi:hypothetical protein